MQKRFLLAAWKRLRGGFFILVIAFGIAPILLAENFCPKKVGDVYSNNDLEKATSPVWYSSYREVLLAAKEFQKPVFAYFTSSDWSKVCIKFQYDILSRGEFSDWADKNVLLLKVDFPHKDKQSDVKQQENRELLKKYKVRSLPTVVLLNEDGKEMGRLGNCCSDVNDYIKHIGQLSEKFGK